MKSELYIQDYCLVRDFKISLNGKTIFDQESEDFGSFIKTAYKHFGIDYAKFFKMDSLSKLAFITSDVLLKEEQEKNIALAFSNRAASLDTDRKHHATMNSYPSPAVFVYTLPNICLGEISIKHQLYSENAFFITDSFHANTLFDYASVLINSNCAEKVLCGWVDFDSEKHDALLYIVSKSGTFEHSAEMLNKLYQNQ